MIHQPIANLDKIDDPGWLEATAKKWSALGHKQYSAADIRQMMIDNENRRKQSEVDAMTADEEKRAKVAAIIESQNESARLYKIKKAAEATEAERQRIADNDAFMGKKYVGCTFDSFVLQPATSKENAGIRRQQEAVLAATKSYAGDIDEHLSNGRNLILIGPIGSGKDHLAAAVTKHITRCAKRRSSNQLELCAGSLFFDCVLNDKDSDISRRCAQADMLVLSDPNPAGVVLNEFQRGALIRVIEDRYRNVRPTIVTMNAANAKEMDVFLGPQIADRLRENAIVLECIWPTYRRPSMVVSTR